MVRIQTPELGLTSNAKSHWKVRPLIATHTSMKSVVEWKVQSSNSGQVVKNLLIRLRCSKQLPKSGLCYGNIIYIATTVSHA